MKNILSFVNDHKKEILMATGAVCIVATSVGTIKAVKSIKKSVKQHENNTQIIAEAVAMNNPEYTEEDAQNDTLINNVQVVANVVKSVAVPTVFAVASAACCYKLYSVNKNNEIVEGVTF